MLNSNKNVEDKKGIITLSGRLDTLTAPDLEGEVQQIKDGLEELVFDFSDLEYISSAELRVLLAAQKIMNAHGTMKVINVNEIVNEIFDVTGFSDILTIE